VFFDSQFATKLGYSCIEENQLSQITEASRFVSEVVNLALMNMRPLSGDRHLPIKAVSMFQR
jgi:isopropylmalate/homocitrate/citramalate synthase